jgi:DNA (cytosine-5)-methyltransferase 1
MTRPRLLDGCCGAGGGARGYVTAGFEVHGIDSNPRLEQDYRKSGAASFTCGDILDKLADLDYVRSFHVIHCSFPCQHYSQMSRCRPGLASSYPDLITPGRELLLAVGVPYVIENVAAARPWLKDPVVLCGVMFGKHVYRHRLFEAGNGITLAAPAPHPGLLAYFAEPKNQECGWNHPVPAARAGHWEPGRYVSVSGHERRGPVSEAMAIDWMSRRDDVAEAVPPYMTEMLGTQVLRQLGKAGNNG